MQSKTHQKINREVLIYLRASLFLSSGEHIGLDPLCSLPLNKDGGILLYGK